MKNEVRTTYKDILTILNKLIPEKWESIKLYASEMEGIKGEMYFYYFPKKLFKPKPVNCYEIARKFGIEENTYNKALEELYTRIKKLKQLSKDKWTNVTILIDKTTFIAEFHFNNIMQSRYTDEQRRLVWSYKYLKTPLESLNKKEQNLINHYSEETRIKPVVFAENLNTLGETKEVRNQILRV